MTKQYEATPSRKVAFLGLGVMGGPMAGHLAAAGHQVTVYNRTAAGRRRRRAPQSKGPNSCSPASATTPTCAP